jgi:hypothetical protein
MHRVGTPGSIHEIGENPVRRQSGNPAPPLAVNARKAVTPGTLLRWA